MPQSLFRLWPAATNVVALHPHQIKVVSCQLTQGNLIVFPVMLLSRDPGVIFCRFVVLSFCRFVVLFLWPAATNVVALRPHQTKRKPTAVPSLFFIKELAQPPHNIFKQRKGRHGVDPAFTFIFSQPRPYSELNQANCKQSMQIIYAPKLV